MESTLEQSSSRNSLTLSMANVAASGISKETLKPFMFSNLDEVSPREVPKRRNASKSVIIRHPSNSSTNIQRKLRATSMNESHLRGVNVSAPEVPEHLKPKRMSTHGGLRSMLYGLDVKQ